MDEEHHAAMAYDLAAKDLFRRICVFKISPMLLV
jgi:hypothetical protein